MTVETDVSHNWAKVVDTKTLSRVSLICGNPAHDVPEHITAQKLPISAHMCTCTYNNGLRVFKCLQRSKGLVHPNTDMDSTLWCVGARTTQHQKTPNKSYQPGLGWACRQRNLFCDGCRSVSFEHSLSLISCGKTFALLDRTVHRHIIRQNHTIIRTCEFFRYA